MEQQPAEETEGSASGAASGGGSSSASAEQCQDGTTGSGRLDDSKRAVGLGSD